MSIISRQNSRLVVFASVLVALALSLSIRAGAQDKNRNDAEEQNMNQNLGQSPALTASLIDAEKNARDKSATVEVRVTGVELIDPALTSKQPMKGQGHLHYQVDDGPVIATTAAKLSFHGLSSGKHKFIVVLANNDHSPAGPQQMLEVTVP